MFFSIIIPTYNRAQYILEAIDSAIKQTYPDFEIIIVDDGSSDDTGSLITQYYGDNKKVRYFYKENEERGAARNFGLNKASGDYAVFFDSDDWMLPDYLDILFHAISVKNPDLVASKYRFRNNAGVESDSSLVSFKEGWYELDTFLKGNVLACNFAIKVNLARELPFPEERELSSMEDWLFLLQHLQSHKIYLIDKIGVVMREHEGRSMANNGKIIKARIKATRWATKKLDLSPGQKRRLEAHSYYFCGIHEYLEGNRKSAARNVVSAIKTGGMKRPFFLLLCKAVIGKKMIDKIK